MRSLTGYGVASAELEHSNIDVEVRCVNHKFLEARVKLPSGFRFLEPELVALLRRELRRGSVEVTVRRSLKRGFSFDVDMNLAGARHRALVLVAERLGLDQDVPLDLIIQDENVLLEPEEPEERTRSALLSALKDALAMVDTMRVAEGRNLADALADTISEISTLLASIRGRLPDIVEEALDRTKKRIYELISDSDSNISEERVEQELALVALKWDVSEELDRLDSHMAQFKSLMASDDGEPIGRRLDFLAQEMYREANTMVTKLVSPVVTHEAIEVKAAVESLREQVQNIL